MNNKLNKLSLKDIGPARIAILAICGIFLLVSSFPMRKTGVSGENGKKGREAPSVKNSFDQEYIRQQENRLKQILQTVEGVGKVEVMITLRSSGEAVLNKDYSREEAGQSESEGSDSKNSDSIKEGEETILSDKNGSRAPYVIKEMSPEISGLLIICEGAGSNRVASRVLQAAQSVYGISADHIAILKMEDQP